MPVWYADFLSSTCNTVSHPNSANVTPRHSLCDNNITLISGEKPLKLGELLSENLPSQEVDAGDEARWCLLKVEWVLLHQLFCCN